MEIKLLKALGGVALLVVFVFFSLFPQLKPDWIHLGRERGAPTAVGDEASVLDPKSAAACFERSAKHIAEEKWDRAITELNEVLRLEPDHVDARYLRGIAWHGQRQFDKAIADLDAVLRVRPQEVDALYIRGEARAELGQITSALADLDAAIRLVPDYAAAHCYRGKLREEARDYRGALADYQQATRLDPDDPWALNNLAWVLAAAPEAELRNGSLV